MAKKKEAAPTEPTQEEAASVETAVMPSQSPFAKVEAPEPPEQEEASKKAAFFDVKENGHLIAKTKIDGQEGEVTMAEALKSYQLQQHLTQKGQALAEKEKEIELKAKLIQELGLQPQQPVKDEPAEDTSYEVSEEDRYIVDAINPLLVKQQEAYNKTMSEMQSKLDFLTKIAEPQVVELNFGQANNILISEGFNDLSEKREGIINAYNLMTPEVQARYNNGADGIVRLYKELKLRELTTKSPDDIGTPAPSVNVEEGTAASSLKSEADALNENYVKTFAKAQSLAHHSPATGNYQDVLRMKYGDKL